MILSCVFLFLIDNTINLNLIGFIPENLLEIVNAEDIGIGSLFCILFILFEFLSVLKNMRLTGLPIPNKLKNILDKILCSLTEEVKEDK